MKFIQAILYFAVATFFVVACGNKQETTEQQSDLIEISSQQFATDSMQLGKVESKTFESKVKCNGYIVSLPTGMAKINTPVSGIVKNINCRNGQLVEKNQVLLELSGNEIIDIQKDFAEVSAIHKRLKNEYERIKSLYNEKISSEKDYIIAESDYKASLAKYQGLKLKMEALGFSIIKIENGEFYSSFLIKAPIRGHISSLKANLGIYINSQSELIEIIDQTMLQVKLQVFATDLISLKKGQIVRFKSTNSNNLHSAILNSIGVTVDDNSKSIDCYATISGDSYINAVSNEFIEAEIITNNYTVMALPSNAIIKSETGNFILVLEKQETGKYLFNKVEIKIGSQFEGFTEINESKIEGMIIIKGIYNISL